MTDELESTVALITKPLVHLNGTSREALLDGYTNACHALRSAREAVIEASPNARDYYPLGNDAYRKAEKEHVARLQKLEDVRRELEALALHVSRAGR